MGVTGSRHNAAYACMRLLIVGVFQNPSDGMTECSLVTFDLFQRTSSATLHLEHPVKPSGKAVSYSEQDLPEFTPMPWSLAEIRAAIPPHLFVRDGMRCTAYLARDVLMGAIAWKLALRIDPFFRGQLAVAHLGTVAAEVARWATWLVYWWFQGLIFTGIWVIGHECGHGAFSANRYLCDVVGFITHTLLWTPYFSWKISHHRHHCNHASMERDEVYVPKTRSDLGIPPESEGSTIDYDEYFGDTPIYTLFMLVRQQLLAFPAYLIYNVSGQKDYPKWTNHFDPNSILFNKSQRNVVIASNIGIAAMIALVRWACATWGASEVVKYYGIPWLCVTHWFIMITYLHHTDPELPHYRNREWNFQRGAAATVDRDFLGWMGRFFLHDVAHFHVVHHFFPKMPFFHGPEATAHLKKFIGDYYRYSEKPIFKALWDNYNECQFVEDTGDILFYRNKKGQAVARPAGPYRSTAVAPTPSA
ncbi:Delta(12) fatty acid desaturase [Grifola frondosa]|uniref:Delta(12) fatty acid desaturase n=1 Tax=Grifola frondosa TaxID=5627 RepID=A0A1C7LSK8_GRIFR|nr:Delta(12) fatty acid desaturase [Grifola frondosa]